MEPIIYSIKGKILHNLRTGTKVVASGNHGDKTTRYQFEGHRILEDGTVSEEAEWFQKMAFYKLEDGE